MRVYTRGESLGTRLQHSSKSGCRQSLSLIERAISVSSLQYIQFQSVRTFSIAVTLLHLLTGLVQPVQWLQPRKQFKHFVSVALMFGERAVQQIECVELVQGFLKDSDGEEMWGEVKWATCTRESGTATVYIVNERRRRKEGRSKQGQTNNNAKQHSTPKAVTFPKKNELPQVGLEPTTLYTLDRVLPAGTCTCTYESGIAAECTSWILTRKGGDLTPPPPPPPCTKPWLTSGASSSTRDSLFPTRERWRRAGQFWPRVSSPPASLLSPNSSCGRSMLPWQQHKRVNMMFQGGEVDIIIRICASKSNSEY